MRQGHVRLLYWQSPAAGIIMHGCPHTMRKRRDLLASFQTARAESPLLCLWGRQERFARLESLKEKKADGLARGQTPTRSFRSKTLVLQNGPVCQKHRQGDFCACCLHGYQEIQGLGVAYGLGEGVC